ncbi:hypothetical protein QBC46DRAFT_403684 [Diplogelasinospora grovesii]|uniref:Uncharacterized protein n=1 Tax=Diplogelasinospora grovesii TaxID=303347 RepID=A0AAN6NGR5_9PEZI|nr:hypothetical protein QBC46DRAFT_403684 [Diplogelasinospora grovesii]
MPVLPFRTPVPVFEPLAAGVSETTASRSRPRQETGRDGGLPGKPPNTTSIIVAAVVVGIIVLIAGIMLIWTIRRRHPNPKYIPTPLLKRLWSDWKVPTYRTRHDYLQTSNDDDSNRRATRMLQDNLEDSLAQAQAHRGSQQTLTAGVDRNTSLRSVMTLPAYRPKATDNEQVLGVEGERDGIDVVVEMPTAEDEEALREEEMDALYQIRLARRRQIADREERRRLRREARENNNTVALRELREQARSDAERNTEEIEELRQEHERRKATRQRAVSSVSYADVGIARADGTRIRANSTESNERVGLLSDAASIAPSFRSSGGPDSLFHRRDRSASSLTAMSIDTTRSSTEQRPEESPGLATGGSISTFGMASAGLSTPGGRLRSRANSGATDTPRLMTPRTAGSSPEIIDADDGDLGESGMPPPGYDDVSLDEITPVGSAAVSGRTSPYNEPPPDYPGPAQVRNNRLSAHMGDLAHTIPGDAGHRRTPSGRGVSGIPQLPSLRLNRLPQIVIDPASAR